MREIKFRAWDSYTKKMYSWDELGEMDGKGSLSLWNLLIVSVHHIKALQWTGLLDSKGNPIYEGDIIKTHDWHYNEDGSQTLSEKNKYDVFKVIEYEAKMPFCGFTVPSKCEVVGNKFQHPHLLDKEVV